MGVGWAAGRLIELGERERGLKARTTRTLLGGDGDRGPEGCFDGSGIDRVAFQQNFAAKTIQERKARWHSA